MEGKSLSNGVECGDGVVYNYGIIVVSSSGYNITFTHKKEILNFDSFYAKQKQLGTTVFFLPSIFRNGKSISSTATVDKVLIRRDTPDGSQIGVIMFDQLVDYNRVRKICIGLDRKGKSKTTHIYVLDGGPSWGQSVKTVNGNNVLMGIRNANVVTNYLVFY